MVCTLHKELAASVGFLDKPKICISGSTRQGRGDGVEEDIGEGVDKKSARIENGLLIEFWITCCYFFVTD